MSEPTFNCGDFFPGGGPFNFPDYIGGGNVGGPNGENPGIPPGGPNDPPVGPPGGPDITCECRVSNVTEFTPIANPNPPPSSGNNTPLAPNKQFYRIDFAQKCTQIINGFPTDNSSVLIRDEIDRITQAGGVITETSLDGAGVFCETNTPLPDNPCYRGECPGLYIIFYVLGGIPGDPGPGPVGGGGPGDVGSPNIQSFTCKIETVSGPVPQGGTGGQTSYVWTIRQRCVYTPSPGAAEAVLQHNVTTLGAAKDAARNYGANNQTFVSLKQEGEPGKACGPRAVGSANCEEITLTLTLQEFTIPEPPNPGPTVGDDPPGGGGGGVTGINDVGDIGPTGVPGEIPGVAPFSPFPDPPNPDPDPGGLQPDPTPNGEGPPGIRIPPQRPGGGLVTVGGDEEPVIPDLGPIVFVGDDPPKDPGFTGIDPVGVSQVTVNLNDPNVRASLLQRRSSGIQDPEIFIDTSPTTTKMVRNPIPNTIFADKVDSSIAYYLNRKGDNQDWDSRYAYSVNANKIMLSLKPEIRSALQSLSNFDGSKLSTSQIESMISNRLINGRISELDTKFFLDLVDANERNNQLKITRSDSSVVNELAALSLIEKSMFPISPEGTKDKPTLGWSREKMKNYKVFATDVDKFIPVVFNGEIQKCFVNDDQTFIERSSLKITDGDYFLAFPGGSSDPVRLYSESEIDHAFTVPERTRQQAIKLLGGSSSRNLEVTLPLSANVEAGYDLTASRENYYFLSANLETVATEPILGQSRLLNQSTMQYEYVPVSSQEDLDEINDYIKYKGNHLIFMLDDDDRIFDYLENGSKLSMSQTDIISEAPKENKSVPVLTRQMPWYIMLVPTNRPDMLVFDNQSHISDITDGNITRQLKVNVSLSKEFASDYNSRFIQHKMEGVDALDVQGVKNVQARITKIVDNDLTLAKTYVDKTNINPVYGNSKSFPTSRKPSAIRILSEVIKELDDNYGLGINGFGKSVTEFDVFSRFTLSQWSNLLIKEQFDTIKQAFYSGLIQDVKIIPAVENADSKLSLRKTQLVLRRPDAAEEDKFKSIKSTNSGKFIIPPTKTAPARIDLQSEKEQQLTGGEPPPAP